MQRAARVVAGIRVYRWEPDVATTSVELELDRLDPMISGW